MRDIKFRGYCDRDSEWREGFYITDEKVHEIHTILKCGSLYPSQVYPETVGQYTGLKDINGVEIYEGDICSMWYPPTATCKCVVDFKDGAFWINTTEAYPNKDLLCSAQTYGNFLEVIGNVHENPELIV